jgi:hypothetical protein
MTKISKLSALAGALVAVAALALAGAGTALAAPSGAPAARAAHPLSGTTLTLASGTTTGTTDTNTSYCYEPSPLPTSIIDDPVHPTCRGRARHPKIVPTPYPGWGAPLTLGSTVSRWVGPQTNGEDFSEVVPGWYIYDREFKGCAVFSGQAMADNEFGVFLNNTWLADSSATSPRSFEHPMNFSGSTNNPGVNVIDFVVHDLSEPATGLDYLFQVTPTPCSWTDSPGGSFKATSVGAVTFKDASTGTTITCSSSDASGTLEAGKGLSGTGIGSIKALSYSKCSAAGIAFTLTPNTLPLAVNALSYSGGVTGGTITGIDATLTAPSCSATVDGTAADGLDGQVAFSYSNKTGRMQALTSGGDLTAYNVSGCLGLINSGDPLTVSGTYQVTPHMTITGS